MQLARIKQLCLLFALTAAAALTLNGCAGKDGQNGANAPIQTTGTVNASTFTTDNLNNVIPVGKIMSASIPGKSPVVTFQVVDKVSGAGITGLKTFGLHVAKLIPEDATTGTSSSWANYIDKGISLPAPLAFGVANGKAITGAITKPAADPGTTLVPANQNGLDLTLHPVGSVLIPGYTVVDHNDGTYTVTFGSDITSNPNVTFDPTALHRIGVTVTSIATPGVTPVGPVNPVTNTVVTSFNAQNRLVMVYDFTPSTGAVYVNPNGGNFARDIVTTAACNQCHSNLADAGGHFARWNPQLCVMCHTSTNTSGEGEFVTFIHRIHMGEDLPAIPAAESVLNPTKPLARTATLVTYGDQTYPQDIRNCTQCHQGVDGANWMTRPNRKNCGSCHNNINFATGVGHTAPNPPGAPGAQPNDNSCTLCHGGAAVSATHLPIVPPSADNAVSLAFAGYSTQKTGLPAGVISINSNTNAAYTAAASLKRLPAGAKSISYVINKVSRNASKQPTMEFKFQVATADANGVLGTPVDVVFNTPNGTNEMITGFVGSPSVYFAFAVPQDGISKPADYNASASGYLKRIWNGTASAVGQQTQDGTLVAGPTAGYYTVTLTNVTVPDSAVLLTGGLGYTYGLGSYSKGTYDAPATAPATKIMPTAPWAPFLTTTQPLTQIDLPNYPYVLTKNGVTLPIGEGGLSVPATNVWKAGTGYTARRVIVDNAKCNACHGRLGVKPTFHAGQRNDAPTCTFCHNVNRVNSGWGVNIKDAVHAIHGSAKRVNKFSWEASAGATYWKVTYPGILRNCEECHVAGMYDFSNSVYTANNGSIFDSLLFTTAATGKIPNPVSVVVTGNEPIPGTYYSPFVTAGANYGAGFSFNAGAVGMPTSSITKQDGTKVGLAPQATFDAEPTTLVNSPIAAACAACHDTAVARAHMNGFGGSISAPRSTALTQKETCIVCHGTAANPLNATPPSIKAVHRWW